MEFTRDRFNIATQTQIARFAELSYLMDKEIGRACVSVLSSDGTTGTISHLTIFHGVRQFAKDLRDFAGKDGVAICLSGGWDEHPGSPRLVAALLEDLPRVGFRVSSGPEYADLLGNFLRRATVFPDKVVVQRIPVPHEGMHPGFDWTFSQKRELIFPH